MIANNEDMLSFLLWLGQQACIFGLGNVSASIVPFSCGGASDAPQLAARVRRRRFTSTIKPDKRKIRKLDGKCYLGCREQY